MQQPSTFELYLTFSNMHILKPNPASKYKVRLLINHHSAQKQLNSQPHKNKMRFYLTMDSQPLTADDIAQVCLLQRTVKDSQSMGYIEIGRGSLDMGEVSRSVRYRQADRIDGLIYGTRAYNYDKIIAKFTYKAHSNGQNLTEPVQVAEEHSYSRVSSAKRQKSTETIKNSQKNIPVNPKMQQLSSQNQAINEKMEKLSKSIAAQKPRNHTRRTPKRALRIEKVPSFFIEPQPVKVPQPPVYPDILWHYDTQTQAILKHNKQHQCLCLYLPNIKLYRYPVLIKDRPISLTSKVYTSPSQSEDWILVTFYSLRHETRTKRKWLQIITKLQYNVNNQILQNLPFYAPKDKDIHVQVTPANAYHQNLLGQTRVGSSRQKLIQLSNSEGEESGFLLVEVMDTPKEYKHIEQYWNVYVLQKDEFAKERGRFKAKHIPVPSAPIDLMQSDNFSFSPVKKKNLLLSRPKKHSGWSEGRSKRMELNYSLQRAKEQIIPISSRKKAVRSLNMDRNRQVPSLSPGIRHQSPAALSKSLSPSPSPLPRKIRYLNRQAHQKYDYYCLQINRIYFNCYHRLSSSTVILRWSIQNVVKIKRVFLGQNDVGSVEVDFGFNTVLRRDRLKIQCCVLEQRGLNLLGRCEVEISKLFESGQSSHKVFIQNVESMVGYLVFDFDLKLQTTPPRNKIRSLESPACLTRDPNANEFLGVDENYGSGVRDTVMSEIQLEQTYM